ncbi:MAG: Crp/Fnr family transcriptional regulator [Clostridium sp.]|nr:Crp/Fnr family transcriptional regulator [Clostridium sp.]
MQKVIDRLMKNRLFKGLDDSEIREIINLMNYSVNTYQKNEIIAHEEDDCNSLGLVIEGSIAIKRLHSSGKEIIMKTLKGGDVFGEALIFSKFKKYPATVVSGENCKVLYLTKNEIIKLFSFNSRLMENYMGLLSEKVIILNNKIKSLSLKSVRQKVVDYILQECIYQKTNVIRIRGSKEELASYIGIPRPSLSRELIKLREENIIEFDRYKINVFDVESLEQILFD